MFGPSRSIGSAAAAVVLAALASGAFTAPAHGAAAKSVILIQPPTGGITPKGDPVYNFTAQAYLAGGYDMHIGDFFRIESVIGVNSTSTTNQPFPASGLLPPGDHWTPDIEDLAADAIWPGANHETVDTANVTWYLTSIMPPGLPIENCPPDDQSPVPPPLFLGLFTFQTYDDFSTLPNDFSITFNYFVHAHDCDGNLVEETGTITYSMVPEPGSIALLALGAAVPAVAAARRRRRAAA
jgi:hypothetical protein